MSGTLPSRQYSPKYSYIRPGSKMSMPAGTDVWVVKTLIGTARLKRFIEGEFLLIDQKPHPLHRQER